MGPFNLSLLSGFWGVHGVTYLMPLPCESFESQSAVESWIFFESSMMVSMSVTAFETTVSPSEGKTKSS